MHFSSSLGVALMSFAFSHGLPTFRTNEQPCDALVETSPWYVSDIIVRNSPSTASTGFSIQFRISDENPGLELNTFCTDGLPAQTSGWQSCEDKQMRFRYNLGNLLIRRSYLDDWYVVLGEENGKMMFDPGAYHRLIRAITVLVHLHWTVESSMATQTYNCRPVAQTVVRCRHRRHWKYQSLLKHKS